MSIISGVGGAVNGHDSVRTWTISSSADIQAAVASNTKQGTVLVDGNTDWNGTLTVYGDTPVTMPTKALSLIATIDGTNGAVGTAICDSIEIVIDIEAGLIISHTVNFSGNGALVLGAAVATDVTVPCPASSIGTKVTLGSMITVPVFTEIPDVRTATITITADNKGYASSSTAGGMKRVAGNVSAAIVITVYEGDPADLPLPNDEGVLRVYVNATEFWEFSYVKFGEISDVGVDIEAAEISGGSLSAQWTGFADVSSVCTEGAIIKPDTNDYWPLT